MRNFARTHLKPLPLLLTLLVLPLVDNRLGHGEFVGLLPPVTEDRSPLSEAFPLSKALTEDAMDVSIVARGAVLSESVDPVLPNLNTPRTLIELIRQWCAAKI